MVIVTRTVSYELFLVIVSVEEHGQSDRHNGGEVDTIKID